MTPLVTSRSPAIGTCTCCGNILRACSRCRLLLPADVRPLLDTGRWPAVVVPGVPSCIQARAEGPGVAGGAKRLPGGGRRTRGGTRRSHGGIAPAAAAGLMRMTRALAIAADAPQPETSRRRGRIGNRALGLAMRLPDRYPVVRRSFLRTAASSPKQPSGSSWLRLLLVLSCSSVLDIELDYCFLRAPVSSLYGSDNRRHRGPLARSSDRASTRLAGLLLLAASSSVAAEMSETTGPPQDQQPARRGLSMLLRTGQVLAAFMNVDGRSDSPAPDGNGK
jgi:hypothetical protein